MFKSTGKYLKKVCKDEELQGYLTARRIDWTFNVAKVPWHGGFFERMVGISKSTLYKVLGRSKLSFREVETLLIQVEGLMNYRPLTYQTDELEDDPLTPNHMMFGYALPNIASDKNAEIDDDEDYLAAVNKRLKYISSIKAHLWKRWTSESEVLFRRSRIPPCPFSPFHYPWFLLMKLAWCHVHRKAIQYEKLQKRYESGIV